MVSRVRTLPPAGWLMLAVVVVLGCGMVAAGSADARPPLPQCADNLDNDAVPDGRVDWPQDPGCSSGSDATEVAGNGQDPVTQCSDGAENGGSLTLHDYPLDSGCASAADADEGPLRVTQCSNGTDDDGDGRTDLQDPGCIAASDNSEPDTVCSDRLDNDADGRVDFPFDWGCAVPVARPAQNPTGPNQIDTSEVDPAQCDDGRDNDGDGTLDFDPGPTATKDPDCDSATDNFEVAVAITPQCADGFDNDGDGRVDFPIDPGCTFAGDNDESDPSVPPQCADGRDNDGDGRIDLADPGCGSASDNDEFHPIIVIGQGEVAPKQPAPLLSPFPIVRLRGFVERRLTRVTLLSVRAPAGSKVSVYCSGTGCPAKRVAINAGRKLVRVRTFERRLRSGTILKIYVTRTGFVGKYTRFRFLRDRAPQRIDRCAGTPGTTAKPCPS
jgi:hypothetical protein